MILQITLYLTLHKKNNKKFIIRSLYKKSNLNLLAPNKGNTCTKERQLKTHRSSTCSKSNSAVLAPTLQEPASNYTHQSNLSHWTVVQLQVSTLNMISILENDLKSVNKHVFEIQLDNENQDEIPSSPNVPDADLPEIPIETSNTQSSDINELQNFVAQEFPQLSGSDNENDEILPDYFQIEENQQPPQFRNSTTFAPNYFDNNLVRYPIVQYQRDKILASDEDMGWKVSSPDDIPLQGPFTINPGLKVEMTTKNLEDFFFLNFDDHMFETIADQTNVYARNRISSIMHRRDLIQQLDDPTNKKHNSLHSWKDLNAADIKLVMAHVIAMSFVHKSAVHGYWSKNTLSHMPFLGSICQETNFKQYCGTCISMMFQAILHLDYQAMTPLHTLGI